MGAKFKVGDKVRPVNGDKEYGLFDHWMKHWASPGDPRPEYFYVTWMKQGCVGYSATPDGMGPQVSEEDLELVPAFKVGDRVTQKHWRKQDESTVVSFDGMTMRIRTDAGEEADYTHIDYFHLVPLTIQAGKFYKTRDGRKVGPMLVYDDEYFHVRSGSEFGSVIWREDGSAAWHRDPDLIAEWVDEPASQPVAEQPAAKPKFKVGDRVRVFCSRWDAAPVGSLATIRKVLDHHTPPAFTAAIDGGDGFDWFFEPDEIELHAESFLDYLIGRSFTAKVVTPAQPSTPAIVCLMENGRPLPAERPHVHPSTSAAEREAARLADLHKGKEFAVFELGSSCRKEPEYAHEWQRLAAQGNRVEAARRLRDASGIPLGSANSAVRYWLQTAA